jgi:DNA-binding NtrC family response regulator
MSGEFPILHSAGLAYRAHTYLMAPGKRNGIGIAAGKRILVVDDDATIRRSLEILLTRAGYAVTQASNGAEAVRLWREFAGDLVILDMFMPDKDGIETILELRAHTPGVRIIAMSGGGRNRSIDVLGDARQLGAILTIEKPFASTAMMALVEEALKPADGLSDR